MEQKTKLTVRVDSTSLEVGKRFAAARNTSLSRLISEFLGNLPVDDGRPARNPILRKLTGILPARASIEDHRAHLARKYGA